MSSRINFFASVAELQLDKLPETDEVDLWECKSKKKVVQLQKCPIGFRR
jgi:hypothetical protein